MLVSLRLPWLDSNRQQVKEVSVSRNGDKIANMPMPTHLESMELSVVEQVLAGHDFPDACKRAKVDLEEAMLVAKKSPYMFLAYRLAKKREEYRVEETTFEIKQRFARQLHRKARFFDKIVNMATDADETTKEGQVLIMQLMKMGLVRDILPKESAAQVQTQEVPYEMDDASRETLLKEHQKLVNENQNLIEAQVLAQKKREKYGPPLLQRLAPGRSDAGAGAGSGEAEAATEDPEA